MKGDPKVIGALAAGLAAEAHLNLQCRQDQRVVKWAGVKKVAAHIKTLGDCAHAYQKQITKRLLYLGGDAGLAIAPVVDGNRSLTAVLQNLLALNAAVAAPYEDAVATAAAARDDASRNLFEHLLKWHQRDIAWLERQLGLIASLGERDYIAAKL